VIKLTCKPGGGGYGDPLTRAPQRVLEDVLDRKISPDEAREVYGVMIDTAASAVDLELTAQRRAELAAARGVTTEIYNYPPPQGGRIGS
jgi:N-methylhydantoinase B/oxoprolinase/acetone carboxylase alpha subunit